MTEKEIIQIENEVFTQIIMDELRRQKAAGTAINDYLLDKYALEQATQEKVRQILSEVKK